MSTPQAPSGPAASLDTRFTRPAPIPTGMRITLRSAMDAPSAPQPSSLSVAHRAECG